MSANENGSNRVKLVIEIYVLVKCLLKDDGILEDPVSQIDLVVFVWVWRSKILLLAPDGM
jgi:hypothetical protein